MPDFGDEFVFESYKVPWLIWIHLAVMILLIILLFFGLTLFTLEPSTSSAAPPAPAAAPPPLLNNNPSSSRRRVKAEVERRSRGERATSTELTREEVQNGDEDSLPSGIFRNPNHPCNYFSLAKRAVLKCLGLGSSSEPSGSDEREKQD